MSLYTLRTAVLYFLGKSILDLFPDAVLLENGVDELGFSYSFECKQKVPKDFLPHFEERVRGLLKAPPPYRIQSMVKKNAAQFLLSRKQPFKAEMCLEVEDDLVDVLVMENYTDLAFSHLDVPEEVAFKLFGLSDDEGVVTIRGTAFPTLYEVKSFLKRLKAYERQRWEVKGVQEGYVAVGAGNRPLVLPKGQKVIEGFYRFCEKEEAVWSDGDPRISHPLIFKALGRKSDREGLSEWGCKKDFTSFYTLDPEAICKSSLQMIVKTAKMLGFEYHGVLYGLVVPKEVKRKGLEDRWSQGLNWLISALASENVNYSEDNDREAKYGPSFHLMFKDSLGAFFEGPSLQIDCTTLKELNLLSDPLFAKRTMIVRELFPSLSHLFLKWIESTHEKVLNEEID